jgi:hypothetical protein
MPPVTRPNSVEPITGELRALPPPEERPASGAYPIAQDAAPITREMYAQALNSLPPTLRPWIILAVIVFSGGGLANLYALWQAPAQIAETREEVADLREVVCLLAEAQGVQAEACGRRYRAR